VLEEAGEIFLSGPDGPRAWLIETHGQENPMEEVRRTASRLLSNLILLHSTSWRWEGSSVVLTFIAVVTEAEGMPRLIAPGGELARGTATEAPSDVDSDQVLLHALRHLAWLAKEDPVVRAELSAGWRSALLKYVPATFQQIG